MSLATLWEREVGSFSIFGESWSYSADEWLNPADSSSPAEVGQARRVPGRVAAAACCASMYAAAEVTCGGRLLVESVDCKQLPLRGTCEGTILCKDGSGEIVGPRRRGPHLPGGSGIPW